MKLTSMVRKIDSIDNLVSKLVRQTANDMVSRRDPYVDIIAKKL